MDTSKFQAHYVHLNHSNMAVQMIGFEKILENACHRAGLSRQYPIWKLLMIVGDCSSRGSWLNIMYACGRLCAHWVDDISQEAFLIAYRERSTFEETRDFGKWLRGIAANIVRNELRKDARRRRILHTELSELLLARFAETSERSEPLSIEAVRECLDQLTPQSREVVQYRYRDGETAPIIAERFNLSAANVRQKLVRIRRQIKECVEQRIAEGDTT